MLALAVEHSHVRTEKFVCGARQKIAIERTDVNQSMRRIMHGIDVTQRSGLARQSHDFLDIVDRPDRVRRVSDRDQPRMAGDLPCQVVHVERAIGGVELRRADRDAFFFERFPRRKVCIVIEQRQDDLIARAQIAAKLASKSPAHGIGERSHVRAEDNFIRLTIQEVRHCRARFGDHAVRVAAGVVSAAGVGVVVRQIIRNGVDHPLRNLRAAWPVQKDGRLAIYSLCQRWELRANPGEVERSRGSLLTG